MTMKHHLNEILNMDIGHLFIQNHCASAGTSFSIFKVEPGNSTRETLGCASVEQEYAKILDYRGQEVLDYEPCVKLSTLRDDEKLLPYLPEIERVLTNYLARKNMEDRIVQISQALGLDLDQLDQIPVQKKK